MVTPFVSFHVDLAAAEADAFRFEAETLFDGVIPR